MDILMSPEPSTSTQNHEVCVDCTQQPTNTMSTESTQYPQDWEPLFTDNHTEHAATTCKFAVLGTVLVVE
jgi:hypothetical protein